MDVREFNRAAWDREVLRRNPWTVPVDTPAIAASRMGDWSVLLTETIPVPRAWFPELRGLDVLCLASGGGQQAPILAAAGARVTVFDNSPRQLAQDRFVADREGLALVTVEGDMRDLAAFADASFDLVFHPVSNLFVPDVRPVWAEAFRVTRAGGALLAGFVNPLDFVFDGPQRERGVLTVRYAMPYSDLEAVADGDRRAQGRGDDPLEFGHTLDDQIGGQLAAGWQIVGFYEDRRADGAIASYMPSYIATRAVRPR